MGPYRWLVLGCAWLVTSIAEPQETPALPAGAVVRLGVERLRVPGAILDTAFTPDHRTLLVVYREEDARQPNVVLFDVTSGLKLRHLDIRNARHVAIARAQPLMVVHTLDRFELWDLQPEKRVRDWKYPALANNIQMLAISDDGRQIVATATEEDKAVVLR